MPFASRKREITARREQFPEEPWKWRADWAEGRVTGIARDMARGYLIFGALFTAVSSPILFVLPEEVGGGNWLALLGLVLPGAGVGLLMAGLRHVLRRRKFGAVVCELDRHPVAPGSVLEATVRTPRRVEPRHGYHVRLTCVRQVVSGSGDDRSTRDIVLWQEEQEIPDDDGDAFSTAVRVRFALPTDARESSEENEENRIYWRLEVRAEVHGMNFAASFDLPVFATAGVETSAPLADIAPPAPSASEPSAVHRPLVPGDERLQRTGIAIEDSGGGQRVYHFAAARNRGAAVSLGVFTLIWSGAVALMWGLGAPWFFTGFFALFDLLFLYICFELWCVRTEVCLTGDALAIQQRALGITRTETIAISSIQDVKVRVGMQSGLVAYHTVELRHGRGRAEAGRGIRSRLLAEQLAREIRERLPSGQESTPEA